jgi:hypothetical protein
LIDEESKMKCLVIFLITLSTLFAGITIGQPSQSNSLPQDKTKAFMQAKLVGSQAVLEGLVTENFSRIHRGAENMKQMSEALQWPRAEDKVYDHFGDEFRRQCDKLMQLADEKNLEGAHFTYLSMTTTCISCHNYVRGKFRVERDAENPQGPVRLIPSDWQGQTYKPDRSATSGREPRRN